MAGLVDHSEVVAGRTEADVERRYYRAMAAVGADFEGLLERHAETVAETMYDFCVVQLLAEGGEAATVAYHHADPAGLAELRRVVEAEACAVHPSVVRRLVEAGESCLWPSWSTDEAGGSAEPIAFGEEWTGRLHSLMVVPLRTIAEHTLGWMAVGRDATSTPFDATDLALAESMAAHAAMKADTAKLTQELKRTNAQLEEAVELRDMFISIASHELRTPLGAIKLLVQLLQRHEEYDADKLVAIEGQVDRMAALVERLLDVSRLSGDGVTLRFDEIDLVAVISSVVEEIELEIDAPVPTIALEAPGEVIGRWDRERAAQIVRNLLSNAVKYGGGAIAVDLEEEQGESVQLRVTDDGPGIAADQQEVIFERFVRGETDPSQDGLGLGLWIVRELVEQMNGTITLTSEIGRGSTFVVRLPK